MRRLLALGASAFAAATPAAMAAPYTLRLSSAGYSSWTVPYAGNWQITAAGAQGGSTSASYTGGMGAKVSTTLYLAGGTLQFAVGGMGQATTGGSGGGGGGTFVYQPGSSTLLMVAGGGGGVGSLATSNGAGGNAGGTYGRFGTMGSYSSYGAGAGTPLTAYGAAGG